jgi:hypothetical protein
MSNSKKIPLNGTEHIMLPGTRAIGPSDPHELIEISVILKHRQDLPGKRHFLAALFWCCSGFKLDLWWPCGHGGLGWKLKPRLGKTLLGVGGTGLRRRSGGSWS